MCKVKRTPSKRDVSWDLSAVRRAQNCHRFVPAPTVRLPLIPVLRKGYMFVWIIAHGGGYLRFWAVLLGVLLTFHTYTGTTNASALLVRWLAILSTCRSLPAGFEIFERNAQREKSERQSLHKAVC